MTTSERLRKGAARVRLGWVQGYRYLGTGRCVLAALQDDDRVNVETTCPAAVLAVAALVPRSIRLNVNTDMPPIYNASWDVAMWNDAPGQTAENVAAALELAALLEDEKLAQMRPEEEADHVVSR